MSKQRFTWVAVVAALAVAGLASANDRDFLREVAAAPNLIFILDTSSSMVLSPEVTMAGDPAVPTPLDGALLSGANVPGGGDDPYSRLGIAKRVLRDFLDDVSEANVALAGYAQAQPADGSNGVPQKHWVYEARAQDRFHMVEASYAYRLGYNENHLGFLIDLPGLIYPQAMIGYRLYFDPTTVPVTDRFGFTNAYDTGYLETLPDASTVRMPYDLMPVYFGNCLVDDKGTPGDASDDETVCAEDVFPFVDSGARELDGSMITESWYYGDPGSLTFPNCEPSITPTADNPDNGCLAEWEETVGASILQHKRRVHLEIPETVGGQPNHFLAVDSSDNRVGNVEQADSGSEDYDGIGGADPDFDGSQTSDWVMYVASVEERNYKTCAPPSGIATWTPTPTKTYEEYCDRLTIPSFAPEWHNEPYSVYLYAMWANVSNYTGYTAEIVGTYWDWGQNRNATDYVNYLAFGYLSGAGSPLANVGSSPSSFIYWNDDTGTSSPQTGRYVRPLDTSAVFPCTPANCDTTPRISNATTSQWFGVLNSSAALANGIYEVCFDFNLLGAAPDGSDFLCSDVCAVTTGGSFATPTNTPLATATFTWTPTPGGPTATFTPNYGATSTPGGGTATPTPGFAATSTPTPTKTATPRPPTPTQTPSRTPTPVG